MGKLPDRRTIRRLYETLAAAPPNLAGLILRPDGSFEAQFREQRHEPPTAETPAVKTVRGTIFPDDDSPINAADFTLNPISLDDESN